MRIKEIILELREYIDRTKYGCWIDTVSADIHYVASGKHSDTMLNIASNRGKYDAIDGVGTYAWGFENHFVRLEHDRRDEINIDGYSKDIKRISSMLLASCAQPEIERVYIDIRDIAESKLFMMPRQRRELILFIKGETD